MSLYFWLDGFRIVGFALKRHLFGYREYRGSVETVARKVIGKSYNRRKKYVMVSSGHFRQFFARDFGMIAESLINLGYRNWVGRTITYTMDKYVKKGRITTHITFGQPNDFPDYSPESAAYMLHSIMLLDNDMLLSKYADFFRKESVRIFDNDIDKNTGLLRKDKNFSSMKDHSLRQSDCYNNCLLGMFVQDLKKAKIDSPLLKYDYKKQIKKHFWTGSYFLEDLSGKKVITGDANTFPFWTGLFTEKDMAKKVIKSIQKKKLDEPWPLKYTTKEDVPKNLHWADKLAPGYEEDTIWMHLGICYLKFVSMYDKKLLKKYLKQYEHLIKKYKNFLEVYFANGRPFSRPLYVSDESMSWVAGFLDLFKKFRN